MPLTESYWPADTSEELIDVTLGGLLRDAAATVPDRVALVDGVPDRSARRRWTYAELLSAAERVARALLAQFQPGERVGVYAANRAEWVLLQHGASLAGLLLVPLNPAYRAGEAEVILRSSEASGVFCDREFRGQDLLAIAEGLRPSLPHLRFVAPLDEIDAFMGTADDSAPLPDIGPDDLLQIQFTSGTTGVPKGALLHHRGVINTALYGALRAGFPDGGVWVNAMPMFHIGGSSVTHVGCLSRRGTFVLAPGFDPASTLELIESERADVTLLVPTMILAVLDHPDFGQRDLSSLKTIISGAAAVPAALVERTRAEMGCDFSIVFGQTEINGVVTQTLLTDSVKDQAETLGRPVPNVEVKVADPETGKVLPIGEVGEIMVRGYQVMRGYYGLPEATAATIGEDGWLHTGDLGTMDDRGFLRIAGRLKDMIIRGGMNLFPREIEDVIFAHAEVSQASVVGVPDDRWGEIVAAVVVPKDPAAPPGPDALSEHCRQTLAAHKSPRLWFFVEDLPLTPSGKVQKFVLQEWIATGRIKPQEWEPGA